MIDEQIFFICVGGLGFIMLCILGYMIAKDKDVSKRITRFENAIEAVAKEIYKIQKTQKQFQEGKSSMEFLGVSDDENSDENTITTGKKILDIERSVEDMKNYFDEKIIALENRVREYNNFSSAGVEVDEKKIIDMFQNGFSIDSIAKELRIGRGEVEFTLKLANIK